VTEKNISWFHCGRCGSLFQSPAGDMDDRLCPACGLNPSLGVNGPALEADLLNRGDSTGGTARPAAHPGEHGSQSIRKRKPGFPISKLLIGWMVVLVAIVFGVRALWPEDPRAATAVANQVPAVNLVSAQDALFLNQTAPLCARTFSHFIATGTAEERNQFVLDPIATAPRMARFYNLNPLVHFDPSSISLSHSAVLNLPGRKAVETQWKIADGRQLDAVFVEDNGEWRLDWEHYARYSDYPWALFVAGGEVDHGEFRLLARERLADERKNSDSISIVLYAPRFGLPGETGYQSPEFLVKRDTKNGRLLDAAFKLERSGGKVYGVNIPNPNAEGFIRVRVKVRRIGQGMERRFELEDVVACHWYSVDDPGVEISDQPGE
jgi:hypothetical protein